MRIIKEKKLNTNFHKKDKRKEGCCDEESVSDKKKNIPTCMPPSMSGLRIKRRICTVRKSACR